MGNKRRKWGSKSYKEELAERKERIKMCLQEFEEYAKHTPMTEKERRALKEWAKSGESVYDGPCDGCVGGIEQPYSVCFLDFEREEELIEMLAPVLSAEEDEYIKAMHYGFMDREHIADILGKKYKEALEQGIVGGDEPLYFKENCVDLEMVDNSNKEEITGNTSKRPAWEDDKLPF